MDAIRFTPGEAEQLAQLVADVATVKRKLDNAGIPARGVAVRADILPKMENFYGLPRVRTPEGSPIRWGLIV